MSKPLTEEPTDLQIRLRHRYNDGWRHLDPHKFIGTAQPVRASKHKGNDEYWHNAIAVVVVPEDGVTRDEIETALYDTFSGGRCRHEHDCCGCVSSRVNRIRKMGEYVFALGMSYSRNI